MSNKVDLIRRALPHSEYNIKLSQRNAVFLGYSMSLVKRDSYYYNGNVQYKLDKDQNAVIYQVYDIPLLYKGTSITLFKKKLNEAIAEKYINPFIITNEVIEASSNGKTYLKSSKVIPWNKITVIKNYNYTYFILDGYTDKLIGNIKCVNINCSTEMRPGKGLSKNIDIGLMIKSDGSYTSNYQEADYAIDFNFNNKSNAISKGEVTPIINIVNSNKSDPDRDYNEADADYYISSNNILGTPGSYIYFNSDYMIPISNIIIIVNNADNKTKDIIIDPQDIICNPYDNLFQFKESDIYDLDTLDIEKIIIFFDTRGAMSNSYSMKYIPYNNRVKLIADFIYNESLTIGKDNVLDNIKKNIFESRFDINISDYIDENGIVKYDEIYEFIESYDKRIMSDINNEVIGFHSRYINSFTATGKEIKDNIVNVNEIIMPRSYWKDEGKPNVINGLNYVIIFRNNELYKYYDTITYYDGYYAFCANREEINDNDIFEIVLISKSFDKNKNLNNLKDIILLQDNENLSESVVNNGKIYLLSINYDLEKCNIYENDPKNNKKLFNMYLNYKGVDPSSGDKSTVVDDEFIQYFLKNFDDETNILDIFLNKNIIKRDINYTYRELYESSSFKELDYEYIKDHIYIVDLTKLPENYRNNFVSFFANDSNPCNLSIVPKEQFKYFRYAYDIDDFNSKVFDNGDVVERENDIACKLPTNFKYCRNEDQYLVFMNGKRVSKEYIFLTVPSHDTPYDELVLYISLPFTRNDKIDIFYLPFKLFEDYDYTLNDDKGKTNILFFNPYFRNMVIGEDNTMIFADGRKISCDEIEYKGKSLLKIYNDKYYRNIRCTYLLDVNREINVSKGDISVISDKYTDFIDKLIQIDYKYLHKMFSGSKLGSDPAWVNNKDINITNTDKTFEEEFYPRMGIIVQAYKDYYSAYILTGKDVISYTGEDILYKYKPGDADDEIAPVRIYDGNAEIHIPLK